MIKKYAAFVIFIFTMVSCLPQDGGIPRGTFTSTSQSVTCEDSFFILSQGDSCAGACPEGEREATSDDIEKLLNDTFDETQRDDYTKEIIQTSQGVCVPEEQIVKRPTDAITINSDFCVCRGGKIASVNSDVACSNTCSARKADTPTATIIGSVTLGAEAQAIEGISSLSDWCTVDLLNDAQNAASCSLVATDINGAQRSVNVTVNPGTNNFEAVLEGTLNFDESYFFRIVETGSGVENAQTSLEQVRLKMPAEDQLYDIEGNLRIKLVGQYSCFFRTISNPNSGDSSLPANIETFYLDAIRYSFFLPAGTPVTPIAPGSIDTIICHDYIAVKDENDSPAYPRLEYIPDHFALWDLGDPRFTSQDGDFLVHSMIQQELQNYGVTTTTTKKYFFPLKGCVSPSADGKSCVETNFGAALIPFIDSKGISYCPGEEQWQGNNPEFLSLKEFIGVPTEGIYYAEGPREVFIGSDGTTTQFRSDIMIIRENILKKIWFHFGPNGVPVKPTIQTENQATYFYWPPNPDYSDPFVKKKGYQRLYTVKSQDELLDPTGSTTISTTLKPHDRKAACVPASSD
jgi:hypothetical protein